MDNRSIIKYENLLLRIDSQFDDNDFNELSDLIALMLKRDRANDAVKFLQLAVFYQPEIPELWTKLGVIYELNSQTKESSAAYREAARLIRNRLYRGEHEFGVTAEILPAVSSFSIEMAYVH